MKFDYVIGNPPYQNEVESKSETNGQAPRTNIFQYFQIEADKIVKNSSVMIYPGGRWIHQFGKGCKEFGKEQINDKTLQRVDFYPNSKELFGNAADLADGITIVVKNKEKSSNGFNYSYIENDSEITLHLDNPGDELIPLNPQNLTIIKKVERFVEKSKYTYLHERILPRSLFGIESDFVANNPQKTRLLSDDDTIDYENEVKVLTNDKAGKSGRAKWFIADKEIVKGKEKYMGEWQVVVSSANAGGQKRDNQIEIIDNHSCFGRSRVALASFNTKNEAENFYKYCCSSTIRYLFLLTDESLTSLGKKVVDIGLYDNDSVIDFTKSIDEQLFALIGFNKNEQTYIINTIKTIDKKRGKE